MGNNIAFISLGCDKNRVDSEVMIGLLKEGNFNIISEEDSADIIIINTCCFIGDALMESIETIVEMGEYKKTGNLKGLIVCGCISERYKEEIFKEMPEVDAIVGATSFDDILDVVKRVLNGEKYFSVMKSINERQSDENIKKRVLSTPPYTAYIKISEGCDNRCSYCIIPKLKGCHRSRSIENIVEEAKKLAINGVKEIILVGQDTSIYGRDIYGKPSLHLLLEELAKIEDLEWIRLMYAYPETLTDETIDVMAREDKILNYIDMPIQHSNNEVLSRMFRKSTRELLLQKIKKLREKMPDICLRTSLIVGFPGETEEEFNDLLSFIEEIRFDRLGIFTYSREEDTKAYDLENQIDEDIKIERYNEAMELQKQISAEKCFEQVGKTLKVIIEGSLSGETGVYCGRSYKDAPDIDGLVFVESDREIISGEIIDVYIKNATDYDLYGEEVTDDEFTE